MRDQYVNVVDYAAAVASRKYSCSALRSVSVESASSPARLNALSELDTSSKARNRITAAGDANNDHGIEILRGADGNVLLAIDVIDAFDDGVRLSQSVGNTLTDIAITTPSVAASFGVFLISGAIDNAFDGLSVDGVSNDCVFTNSSGLTLSGA